MNKSNHLSKFSNGASYLANEWAYENYIKGQEKLGRPDGKNGNLFIGTREDVDNAIKNSNGDVSKIESALGLPEGQLGDGPVYRVDVINPEEHNLRISNGTESGANIYYNTKVDENGNLPEIHYLQEIDDFGNTHDVYDADGRPVVDVEKTDPKELERCNGPYTRSDGIKHEPNSEGYDGKTSGGVDEAVVDRVPNTPENVHIETITGLARGEESNNVKIEDNNDAFYKPSNEEEIKETPHTEDENLKSEDVPESPDVKATEVEEHPEEEHSEEPPKEEIKAADEPAGKSAVLTVKSSADAVEEPKEDAEEDLTDPAGAQKNQQNVEPEPSEDINENTDDVPKEDVPPTGEAENPEKQKEVEKTPEGNKEDPLAEDKKKEVPDESTEHTDEKTVSPDGAKPEPQKKPEEVSADSVDGPKEEPKIESSEDPAVDKPREEKNDESKGALENNTPPAEPPHEDPNEVKTKPGEQTPAGGQSSMQQLVPDGQQETPKNTMAGLADGQEPKAEPNKTMNGLIGDEEQQNTNGTNNTMNGLTGEDSQTNQSSGNNSSSTEAKEEDDDYKYTY